MLKNQLEDLRLHKDELLGFYRGVVEDNNDPDKRERVRARVWGLHTSKIVQDELEGIPTSDLPWIDPVKGLICGSISGFGLWSVPLQGSHILIFFENGNPDQPRYMGTLPGIPTVAPDTTLGFNDPAGVYPTDARLDESDVHRLARGVSSGTVVDYKNSNLDTGVATAFTGSWDEPVSPYATEYPHNTMLATHGGLLTEWDSTPGNKRFHIYHPSNTYIEIDNDGTIVIKNQKDKFEITIGNRNVHVKGNSNLTVDNNRRDKIGVNDYLQVATDRQEEVGNNKTTLVGGNEEKIITADQDITVGNDVTVGITNDESKTIGNDKTLGITGDHTETIGGNWNVTVTGTCNINVTGKCSVTGTQVEIDGGTGVVSGLGAVTQTCICAFTGSPHPDASTNVKISK